MVSVECINLICSVYWSNSLVQLCRLVAKFLRQHVSRSNVNYLPSTVVLYVSHRQFSKTVRYLITLVINKFPIRWRPSAFG